MPAGRPTLYREEYNDEVISLMGQGYSLTACAGSIGVSRGTIYEWKSVYPEFSDSVAKGEAKRLFFWENLGLTCAQSSEGNAGMIQFGMKNVGAEDWREKVEVTQNSTVTIRDERSKIEAEVDVLLGKTPSKPNGNGAVH